MYFITGASGVGKTTLVTLLEKKYTNKVWAFLHFDSIGVPSITEMEEEYGSPSAWQQAKSYEWVDKIIEKYTNEVVFIEGQVNPQFIHDVFKKHRFTNYKIILLDCNEEQMANRLIHKRKQPELVTEEMKQWFEFIRSQAKKFASIIIDTSKLSEKEVLEELEEAIEF